MVIINVRDTINAKEASSVSMLPENSDYKVQPYITEAIERAKAEVMAFVSKEKLFYSH